MATNNAFQKLRAQVGDGQKSINWYMQNVKNLVGARVSGQTVLKSDIGSLTTNVEIGSMYMYFYDPKWKDKLPFYDTFPLVLPFGPAKGGFYGINVHYLPYMLRAKVLGELLNYADSKTLTKTTKMRLSYQLLNSLQTAPEVRPCRLAGGLPRPMGPLRGPLSLEAGRRVCSRRAMAGPRAA